MTRTVAHAKVVHVERLESRQLFNGLSATYFDNPDFTGASVPAIDATVNFKWPKSPVQGIDHNTFSARWTGSVRAGYSEKYTFTVAADDGARLWVDGQLLVDRWSSKRAFKASGSITLEAGKLYDIQLDYRQNTKGARVSLKWKSRSQRLQVIPASMLYPPSTPSTPDIASVVPDGQTTAVANVGDYGAVGDGVHDDAPAIQAAIDALPAGGILRLEPRTYKLNTGLLIHKPLTVEGNGGLLLLNTSAYPTNYHIAITSTLTTNSEQWTEPVTAGQSTFHVASAPGQFTAGQWVFLELGQDPNDPNEQHFTALTQVAAVTADSITLDRTVPYDINNGTFMDRITAVDSLATDVHVRDVKFDHVDGTIPDSAIYVGIAKDCSIDGVSGRFNMVAMVSDSSLIQLTNVVASLVVGHISAGRVINVWQSDDVRVLNVKADTSADKPVFFIESWARDTSFKNIDVTWRYPSVPRSGVFHFTGGSSGTVADQVRIDNVGPVNLVGQGGQVSSYHFGTVVITGQLHIAPLYLADDLTIGAQHYANPQEVSQTIDLQPGWTDHRIALATGTIKSIKITASDRDSIQWLLVVNAKGQGADYTQQIVSGQTVDLGGLLGFVGDPYPLNDGGGSTKSLVLYTPDTIAAGATLTVDVEYYPPAGA
jgi:hypothetical protein